MSLAIVFNTNDESFDFRSEDEGSILWAIEPHKVRSLIEKCFNKEVLLDSSDIYQSCFKVLKQKSKFINVMSLGEYVEKIEMASYEA